MTDPREPNCRRPGQPGPGDEAIVTSQIVIHPDARGTSLDVTKVVAGAAATHSRRT